VSAVNVLSVAETVYVKERLEKIKSTGYWRVNIRPVQFEERRIESLERCWEIMESCNVLLRGWDYPAVSEKEKVFGDDYVQSGADFRGMVELWKFYQSGQFIHYFSCLEDYRQEEIGTNSRWLGVISTLYRITEIYEFSSRLAVNDVFGNGVIISIKLEGMKDRELFEPDRPWVWKDVSKFNEIVVESKLPTLKFMASVHDEAINKTMEVYSHFGLTDYPRMLLSSDQKRLLEKRL
jgi:hypothetical protein